MVVTLTPELEVALNELASREGVAPEELALTVLRDRLLGSSGMLQSQDEWERRLRGLARNCGVSLPDSAVSSEGIYE